MVSEASLPKRILSLLRLQFDIAHETEAVAILDLVVAEIDLLKALILNESLDEDFQILRAVEVATGEQEPQQGPALAYGAAELLPRVVSKSVVDYLEVPQACAD